MIMQLGHEIKRANTKIITTINIHTHSTNLKGHTIFVNLGLPIRNTQLIVVHECPRACPFNALMTHQQQTKQQHINHQRKNQQICLDPQSDSK